MCINLAIWRTQMRTIVAGRFEEIACAERAIIALESTGFQREGIATFFVGAPGQHDRHGTVGDPEASAGAHHAGAGAARGAATAIGVGTVIGKPAGDLAKKNGAS